MLASQDERHINIAKIEDRPGQCPVVAIFMFYKNMGGRSPGRALYYNCKGVFQKSRVLGFGKLRGNESESGWVSAFNYCPRKKWGGEGL